MKKSKKLHLTKRLLGQANKIAVKILANKKPKKISGSLDQVLLKRILKTIEKTKIHNGHKIRWRLKRQRCFGLIIRTRHNCKEFCPITFYCFVKTGVYFRLDQTDKATHYSDIPNGIRAEIADASDNLGSPTLRRRLLQATGLLKQAGELGEKT
ncbi:MAG: hypothetical protein Q8R34_02390 [bacterium]|nr:hypothetical protein [bacterium]